MGAGGTIVIGRTRLMSRLMCVLLVAFVVHAAATVAVSGDSTFPSASAWRPTLSLRSLGLDLSAGSHADVSCPHGARAADAAPLLHGDERGWRRVLCGIQPHRSMDRRARRLLPALSFEPLAGSQSVFATTGWRRAVPWRARGLAAAQAAGAAREESADGPQRHARPLTNVSF